MITQSLIGLIESAGPSWGWAVFLVWLLWQLHCPLPNHETKLQQFHYDLTHRLERIEVTQIAISEEVESVDEDFVKEVHGRSGLTTGDLKDNAEQPQR